jgi:hypothetical protein
MARLVIPRGPNQARLAAAEDVNNLPADGYKERLAKYIPAESIAFYTFVDKAAIAYYGIDSTGAATAAHPDMALKVLPYLFVLLGTVGTPLYLYKQRVGAQPWKLHAVLSTIAFVLWVYTLGGSVVLLNHWYHPFVAAIAAPVFTFVAGWFEPKP